MLNECRRVVVESQAMDDHRRTGGTARYMFAVSEALQRVGKFSQAAAQTELGSALLQSGAPASGPDTLLGTVLIHLGQVHHTLGSLGKAADMYHRSLEIFEACECALGATIANMSLAYVYLYKGEPGLAVLHAARMIDNTNHAPSFVRVVHGYIVMVEGHAMMGNIDDASDALERLAHTARMLELTGYEHCDIWAARGLLALWRGDLVEARRLVHTARSLLRATDNTTGRRVFYSPLISEANYLTSLANIEMADENHDDVLVFSITAALLCHRLGRPSDAAACLVALAEATDDTLATCLLDALLLPLQRIERSYDMAVALLRSAAMAAARGDHRLAAHRARNALRHFGDIKDTRRIRLAKQLIQAAE